jgi:hypothetical protein
MVVHRPLQQQHAALCADDMFVEDGAKDVLYLRGMVAQRVGFSDRILRLARVRLGGPVGFSSPSQYPRGGRTHHHHQAVRH